MKYKSGIEVHEGDIILVRHGGADITGVVLKIIKPNTEDAHNWSVPEGGILIEGGGFGLSVTKSFQDDEDIVFVRRANDPEL